MIVVKDVQASSLWYQQLLGCESAHGGDEYEQLQIDGNIILQLHCWETEEHAHLGHPDKPKGNGSLLWFESDQFDSLMERISGLELKILEPAHVNHQANHRECWIEDPDGYTVVLSSPYGDTGSSAQ